MYWPLNTNPPKVALGGFIAQSSVLSSSVIGPKVPAGRFKIVVKANGKVYEQFINIEANPAKGFTTQSLELLYKQGMRLHVLQEELAALVDTLDKTMATVTKAAIADTMQKARLAQLDTYKHEIVELNRKSIFFDEFKFRRRVSDLYVAVATSIEPLSASQEKGIGLLEDELKTFKSRFYAMIK